MFTGIVETTGRITETRASASGRRLRVRVDGTIADCRVGESICVHGVCLTVAAASPELLDFDVVPETLQSTNLGRKRAGDQVNIERSLRVGDRLDGHIVQGHVDGIATVVTIERSSHEHVVWLRSEDTLRPFIIPKGSITVDGVSLTIARSRDADFSVALIPTTLQRTTLGALTEGNEVNIETDMVARAIVRRLDQLYGANSIPGVLQNAGLT